MTFRTLIQRSLRFHARAHLGVVLGAAVGSAALVGALAVGDSVRESLRDLAVQRLGNIHYALASNDRFFRARFAHELSLGSATPPAYDNATGLPLLRLSATAAARNGEARANHVQLLGVPDSIGLLGGGSQLTNLPSDCVALNEALATQLGAKIGDTVLLRVLKPSALSPDAVIAPRNESTIALRVRVEAIVPGNALGNFNLAASQVPPFNAFMRLDDLANRTAIPGRANLLLSGPVMVPPDPANASPLVKIRRTLAAVWPRLFYSLKPGPAPLEPAVPTNAIAHLNDLLRHRISPADFEHELHSLSKQRTLELRSPRIFLEDPIIRAAHAMPSGSRTNARPIDVLTYFVNLLRAGERTTPYSMVTGIGSPVAPEGMRDDEILVNQWLADDLQVGPGADIALSYFVPDAGARLVERTNHFHVRAVVPMELPYADRSFMPEFPGIAKAESTHDWDAGFPLVHKIRPQDDKYWKEWRGTPKAFVTLAAGQKMWANRFGKLTAIRFPVLQEVLQPDFEKALVRRLLSNLKPEELGLRFEPVRAQALAAANQAQDFGQLFLGFSFFLILAALILIGLLFQFGLEQRATEIGTFLALGFRVKQVRRLLLWEGTALGFVGSVIGMVGGLGYAAAMLKGLTTIWRGAVGTSALGLHVTSTSLMTGLCASVLVSAFTIWLVLRGQAHRPARELLTEGSEEAAASMTQNAGSAVEQRRALPRSFWIGSGALVVALGMIAWALMKHETDDAETFFSAGSLCLIAGLAFSASFFSFLGRWLAPRRLTISSLGLRGGTRRRKRSLAVVSLLACGSFLVLSIGAFKLDANANAWKRSSGTGGFALLGQSALPIVQDLNTPAGQEFFGLNPKDLQGVSFVPLRVREGDEASCLNLNRAQTARLLGVNPRLLHDRGAFTFAKMAEGFSASDPWLHLESTQAEAVVPAIADVNSIVWAMGKKVGDTIVMQDEHGQRFDVKLVGGLVNSILQGSILISEEEFLKGFPGQSGYRMFLIDVPSNNVATVSATLTRALQDAGLELTSAPERLAAFNTVQNTYLKTFQVLGGLGLLLGSAGLGVVVLRNVLERRSELGLLKAVGFRQRSVHWLVLSEHGGLLSLGLLVGMLSALVAIAPSLLASGAAAQYGSWLGTLAAIFLSGLLWTWLATRLALRGELLKSLRNE